jgi:HSP20 family molecular chaperone IbpA
MRMTERPGSRKERRRPTPAMRRESTDVGSETMPRRSHEGYIPTRVNAETTSLREALPMNEPALADQVFPLTTVWPEEAAGHSLSHMLGDLESELARVSNGEVVTDGRDPSLQCWEDDEFLYLEANLPGPRGQVVDISINEGKVFIRLAR